MLHTNVPVNVICITVNLDNAKLKMTDYETYIFRFCFGTAKEENIKIKGFLQQGVFFFVYESQFQPFILTS